MACPSTLGATLATKRFSGDVRAHFNLKPASGALRRSNFYAPCCPPACFFMRLSATLRSEGKAITRGSGCGLKELTSYAKVGTKEVYIPEE